MLITEASAVTFLSLLFLLLILANTSLFLFLRRLDRISIRIIDMLSEMSIALSRIEQALHNAPPSPAEMRDVAAATSSAIGSRIAEVEKLLADSGAQQKV